MEYCLQVDEMYPDSGTIKFKQLPEVPMAVCLKHVGTYDRLPESFAEVNFKGVYTHHWPAYCHGSSSDGTAKPYVG